MFYSSRLYDFTHFSTSMPPSLQPSVAGPVSVGGPAIMKESPLVNGSASIKTFTEKCQGSPIIEPELVSDHSAIRYGFIWFYDEHGSIVSSPLSVANMVSTPGQDLLMLREPGIVVDRVLSRQLSPVEFTTVQEPISTRDGTLLGEDGSLLVGPEFRYSFSVM